MLERAVPRPWDFPESMVSNRSEEDLALEIVREELFRRCATVALTVHIFAHTIHSVALTVHRSTCSRGALPQVRNGRPYRPQIDMFERRSSGGAQRSPLPSTYSPIPSTISSLPSTLSPLPST
eukprot:1117383-Pyramimonas_sp.AAC.1